MTMTVHETDSPSEESTDDVVVAPVHVLPRAPGRERTARRRIDVRPTVRNAAMLAALVLACYVAHDRLVSTLIYNQRQEHLAAEMRQGTPTIESGEAVAILQAETIGLNLVVVDGVDADHLRGAPALLAGSALPGDAGVMVVLGHRDVYGSPFRAIADLQPGASIVAQARNSGPIVRYVVDRVERGTAVDNVVLDRTDRIAYLVLVTNESKWFSNESTVVVARALPVTTADAAVPDLTDISSGGVPFGIDALLAVGSGVAAALGWLFLRRRAGDVIRIAVIAPCAMFAAIRVLMLLDGILPIAR